MWRFWKNSLRSEVVCHSESTKQERILIDPSLYPLVYAESSFVDTPIESPEAALRLPTFGTFPGSIEDWDTQVKKAYPITADGAKYGIYPYSVSPDCRAGNQRFSWLPSEFIVAKDGTVTIKSYINNLHPVKHAEFYPTIATIFGRFVPLFENVITDILYTRKQRVKPNWPSKWITSEPEPKDVGADDCKESYIKWRNSMRRVEPQPKPFVTPERPTTPFSLRGRRLQAVVKMASIELTPKNPKYGGEDWHVEALANERIVATGIYYYDAENITECSLSFREMVSLIDDREKIGRGPIIHSNRNHYIPTPVGWRDNNMTELSQTIGDVVTRKDWCIAFPNTYQHCISGFELADPAKPGHQKMLVIHLIDPVNPTVLTEIVPPQQQSWWREVVLNTTQIGELPHVVTDILFRHVDFPIPPKDAKKTRLRLISARINANIEYIRSYFEAGAFNSDIPWDYIW